MTVTTILWKSDNPAYESRFPKEFCPRSVPEGMSKFVCLHIWHNICRWWGLKSLFNSFRKTWQTQFWISSVWYNNHHKIFFKNNFSVHKALTALFRHGFFRLGAKGGEGGLSGLISPNWQMLKSRKLK